MPPVPSPIWLRRTFAGTVHPKKTPPTNRATGSDKPDPSAGEGSRPAVGHPGIRHDARLASNALPAGAHEPGVAHTADRRPRLPRPDAGARRPVGVHRMQARTRPADSGSDRLG